MDAKMYSKMPTEFFLGDLDGQLEPKGQLPLELVCSIADVGLREMFNLMRQWFFIGTECQTDLLSKATHSDCHMPI